MIGFPPLGMRIRRVLVNRAPPASPELLFPHEPNRLLVIIRTDYLANIFIAVGGSRNELASPSYFGGGAEGLVPFWGIEELWWVNSAQNQGVAMIQALYSVE